MKTFIRLLSFSFVTVVFLSIVSKLNVKEFKFTSAPLRETTIKIAVINNAKDPYPSEIIKSLKDIENREKGTVEFNFFDANYSQNTENQFLNTILNSKEYPIILVDLVDVNAAQTVIDKAKNSNIPIILFHREPLSMNPVRSYNKAIFIGSNPKEAGALQGKALVNEWNKKKSIIDRNRNNTMEYILLKGIENNLNTIGRSKASIETIVNAGIRVDELSSKVCNWNKEEARKATESLLVEFGDKIEVVNSNNDFMALGAIEALQTYGFNQGGDTKIIPVVGVDGIPEAKELIDKGIMTNTVIIDAKATAEALYSCSMNMVKKKKPLVGTNYQFDSTGVAVRTPVRLYKPID